MARFVNDKQTPEERRDKYKMLRYLGLSLGHARKLRDFTVRNIEKRIMYYVESTNNKQV